jgi:Flp pilus assembly protein TadG
VSQVPDRARIRDDDGAAVVEFVLVGVLLCLLFLAVAQVGLALYVRNTLVACAAEGARYGADADRNPDDGAAYARALISRALSYRFARDVTAGYDVRTGAVEVQVRAAVPVVGLLGPPRTMVVRGHALEESR